MSYEVIYNNVNLHDHFNILKVSKRVLPKRTNFTKDIPSRNGYIYLGYKYEPKEIVLDCLINSDDNLELTKNMEYIAFLLDVNNPSRLIISDDPFKYYLAIVAETEDLEQIRYNGKFRLKFVCFDPIAYGIDPEIFFNNINKVTTVSNPGTTNAFPKISVEFNQTAHFLQCTNYDGRTVLVGTPPNVEKANAPFNPIALNDNCTVLTGWTTVSSASLDLGRVADGSIQVNGGGYGFTYGNLGTSELGWHGGAIRKNLAFRTEQFEAVIRMEHNSKGDIKGIGSGVNPPTTSNPETSTVKYKITAEPSLRIRSGRGLDTSQVGSIPKDKIVDVSEIYGGWGKVTYNGKTGYISMQYCKLYVAPVASATAQYKITAKSGVNVRSGRGTNYSKLTAIPYNTTLSVSEISSSWGKVTYNGKTGYISMQYCSLVSGGSNYNTQSFATENEFTINNKFTISNGFTTNVEAPSAENRLGLIEVYGYDSAGAKLFKTKLYDSAKWYESTTPEIEIGSNLVLADPNKTPAPKTETVKIDDKTSEVQQIDSGKFGDWNEFDGYFKIKRIKNSSGKFEWQCSIEKLGSDGKVIKSMSTQTLIDSKYPQTSLSNIVIFFGQYKSEQIVDTMCISDIKINDLSTPPTPEQNKPLFKQGDELLLDFESEKIYKNSGLFMNELDIGSQFFNCPVGNSQFICRSDDSNIDIITSIQTRWL